MSMAYASLWPSWRFDSAEGISAYASFLRAQMGKAVEDLEKPLSLRDGRAEILQDLESFAESCSRPGWDGYGAEAVSPRTLENAQSFVNAFPQGIPMPTIGAEPDGHLTLEWYRSPNWVLSVSVTPENKLCYAAILGNSKAYGEEPFLGWIPERLMGIITRLPLK